MHNIKNILPALLLLLIPSAIHAQKSVRIDKQLTIYNDVMRQLDMNYTDTLNYEDLIETSINQMLRKVDPYTVYYPKKKDEELKMMTTGKYGGIGAIIQQRDITGKNGKKETITLIANPYEGKPAQQNDVLAGDQILSVDGWETKGKLVSEVSEHLRGLPGSTVTLKLKREGIDKPITRSFERANIHLEPVEYAGILGTDNENANENKIGYIGFSEFTEGSASQFQQTLYDLVNNQGAEALVIDLRGNGGGIIDEAIQLLSNFLDKGTEVVSVRGKNEKNNRTYKTQSYPLYRDLPIAVLVNHTSASASEIVAGALQDLKRATLVGERTFGKGLVQNVRPIAYDGHLKVTTAKYYLPSGRCIQAIDYAERQRGNQLKRDTAGGILPDIVTKDSAKVDVCYALFSKNMFFDYATRYHRLHDSIAQPEDFTLTDSDIQSFCEFLDEQKFEYETETGKYYKELMKIAKQEDIDSTTMAKLDELQTMLKPSFREAIQRNLDEVKEMLGAEIVQRYYFQKGRAAYMLRFDDELGKAVEVLTKTITRSATEANTNTQTGIKE